MRVHRGTFLRHSAAAGASFGVAARTADKIGAQGATDRPGSGGDSGAPGPVPASIRALKPMTAGIAPITHDERRARIEKARRLMTENRIDVSSSRADRACSISLACGGG